MRSRGMKEANDFEAGYFAFSTDGKKRPGIRIWCSRCTTAGTAPVSTVIPGDAPQQYCRRTFEAKGWVVGRNRREDVCPACLEAERIEREKKRLALLAQQKAEEKTMSGNVVKIENQDPAGKAPAAQAPAPQALPVTRTATPSDRRRILEAIEIVERQDGKGYKLGSSDDTVARTLNVPRAWVAEVRVSMFGWEDTSEALRAARSEVDALLAEQKRIFSDVTACAELQRTIARAADDLQRKIDALRTKLGA